MTLSNLSFFLLATTTTVAAVTHEDYYDIPATSRLGQSLLQNARSLGNNNNNVQGTSWQAGYSIKFHSCATGDYFGGNNDGDVAQEGNNDGFVYKQRLAHFQLCPTNTCGSSKRGCNDYVTDLSDFVAMYIQNKMEMEATACENVREGCFCEDATDDGWCYSDCYAQAGLSYCEQQQDGGNNYNNENGQYINLQEAVYCTQLDVSDEAMEYYLYNNQNQNNQQEQQQQDLKFFVGPHCHHGKVILGLFTEETCSIKAARGSYETMFYGQHLPHSSTSIIESKCMSCKVPNDNENDANNINNNDNQNNQNQNNKNGDGGDMYYYKDGQMYQQQQQQQVYEYEDEPEQVPDEVTEACSSLYAQSAKCEESLHVNGVYPDTRACNYIRTLKKDGFGFFGALRRNNVNVTPSILAGVFAATTVMFAGLSVYLYRMVKRSNVNVKLLHSHDGTVDMMKSNSDSGRLKLRDRISRLQFRDRGVRREREQVY